MVGGSASFRVIVIIARGKGVQRPYIEQFFLLLGKNFDSCLCCKEILRLLHPLFHSWLSRDLYFLSMSSSKTFRILLHVLCLLFPFTLPSHFFFSQLYFFMLLRKRIDMTSGLLLRANKGWHVFSFSVWQGKQEPRWRRRITWCGVF